MQRACSIATSRRALLRNLAAGVATASIPSWSAFGQSPETISISPITDELAVLRGVGVNVVVLSTTEGRVLVDSGAEADRGPLLATLGERPEDVTAVFNTHWHPDQVGSNEALGGLGATIFAHEKTRLRLTTGYYRPDEDRYIAPLDVTGLPTETIYESGSIEVGGHTISYGYLIEAHTDGDIYVSMPDRNVIAAGDVISPGRDPVFDWFGGGWLGGRLDALAKLLEISDAQTRFVPGRGPVVGRAEIQAEHDMLQDLFERMVEHLRLGETPRDMLEAGVLDGLGREFTDPFRLLYDLQKGFWAHHNTLMHDIV